MRSFFRFVPTTALLGGIIAAAGCTQDLGPNDPPESVSQKAASGVPTIPGTSDAAHPLSVTVAGNMEWGIGAPAAEIYGNGYIYSRPAAGWYFPPGGTFASTPWTKMPGAGLVIAGNATNNIPWVINTAGNIYKWNGMNWDQKSGCATDIAVGEGDDVWVIGCTGAYANGRAVSDQNIYRFDGHQFNPINEGKALFITANGPTLSGNGLVFVAGLDTALYKWTGAHWQKTNGAVSLAPRKPLGPWSFGANITQDSTSQPTVAVGGPDGGIYRFNGTGWEFLDTLLHAAIGIEVISDHVLIEQPERSMNISRFRLHLPHLPRLPRRPPRPSAEASVSRAARRTRAACGRCQADSPDSCTALTRLGRYAR
jgi:hypothetical protein